MNKINAIGGLVLASGVVTIKKGFERTKTEETKTFDGKWVKETLIDCGLFAAGAMTSAIGLLLLCADVTVNPN